MRNLRCRLTKLTATTNYDHLPGNHSTFSLGYTIVPIRKHHTIHDNNCQICHSTASQTRANKVVAERRLKLAGSAARPAGTYAVLARAARARSPRLGAPRLARPAAPTCDCCDSLPRTTKPNTDPSPACRCCLHDTLRITPPLPTFCSSLLMQDTCMFTVCLKIFL